MHGGHRVEQPKCPTDQGRAKGRPPAQTVRTEGMTTVEDVVLRGVSWTHGEKSLMIPLPEVPGGGEFLESRREVTRGGGRGRGAGASQVQMSVWEDEKVL